MSSIDSKLFRFSNGVLRLEKADRKAGEPLELCFFPTSELQSTRAKAQLGDGQAMKVFASEFDPSLLDHTSSVAVPTQALDTITGRLSDGDRKDLLALLGRCFFSKSEVDTWNVVPHLVGPGPGKSVITQMLAGFFPADRTATIDSSVDDFGLGGCLATQPLVLFAHDMGDATESVVRALKSSDPASYAIKHGNPIEAVAPHGVIVGTTGASLDDGVIDVTFKPLVEKVVDDTLLQDIIAESGAVLVKLGRAYAEALTESIASSGQGCAREFVRHGVPACEAAPVAVAV